MRATCLPAIEATDVPSSMFLICSTSVKCSLVLAPSGSNPWRLCAALSKVRSEPRLDPDALPRTPPGDPVIVSGCRRHRTSQGSATTPFRFLFSRECSASNIGNFKSGVVEKPKISCKTIVTLRPHNSRRARHCSSTPGLQLCSHAVLVVVGLKIAPGKGSLAPEFPGQSLLGPERDGFLDKKALEGADVESVVALEAEFKAARPDGQNGVRVGVLAANEELKNKQRE